MILVLVTVIFSITLEMRNNVIYAYLKHHLKMGTGKSKMQPDITVVVERTYVKSSRIYHPELRHLA